MRVADGKIFNLMMKIKTYWSPFQASQKYSLNVSNNSETTTAVVKTQQSRKIQIPF